MHLRKADTAAHLKTAVWQFLKQILKRALKSYGDFLNALERDISFSALRIRNIIPMQAASNSQLLLRNVFGQP